MARSAASLMMTRGPKPMPLASLSGSLLMTAVTSMVALPIVSRAPGLRSNRASSVESTAAPNAPSRCASARSSGMSGSSAILP